MKTYLADTAVLIDHFRGQRHVFDFLLQYKPAVSIVTIAELIQGTKNINQLKPINNLIIDLPVIQVNHDISQTAILLMKKYFHSHCLQYLDALIAATAIEEGLTLVTTNIKHFQMIKKLQLSAWPL